MVDSRELISKDTVCSPTPLVHVVMSMVANHAPSVPILIQFPSGSMSVNLVFQLSDKTLHKILVISDIGLPANKLTSVSDISEGVHNHIPKFGADLALKKLCFWWMRPRAPCKGSPLRLRILGF